jgi:hypothetical protein
MNEIGGIDLCQAWGDRKASAFRQLFWERQPPLRAVFTVNPYRSHQRLHVQQGLFLCPGDVSINFEDNLLAMEESHEKVRLILIECGCREEILWKFQRAGLSRELLFPGLDGFAGSLSVAGPLLYLKQRTLERHKARVPTDDQGRFLWKEYLQDILEKKE